MSTLLICCAGKNTRFHNAGFDIPKYLLPWRNTTVIATIIENLNQSFGPFEKVLVVANIRDRYFKEQLEETVFTTKTAMKSRMDIIYIPDTKGQAETAYKAIESLADLNTPVFIHNADTILYNRDSFLPDTNFDGHIDCFESNSPNYSYVRSDGGYIATEIKEREVITNHASSGLYVFKSVTQYTCAYEYCVQEGVFDYEEHYISKILGIMIDQGLNVTTSINKTPDDTIVLGTPEEYGLAVAKKALNEKTKRWPQKALNEKTKS